MIPVFLLLAALVVDAGNWYAHKRSLQNRADAGALAAGLEYVKQLKACQTTPGTTGTTIANVAKAYAGTNESVGTTYNKNVNNQGERHGRDQRDEPDRRGLDRRRQPMLTTTRPADGWSPSGGSGRT